MRRFIEKSLACLTGLAVSSASLAFTPFAVTDLADTAITATPTTTTAATTATSTSNDIENTSINVEIEQIELTLEELKANDYTVTVDVYCDNAVNGIVSFNDVFLYFAPIDSPENDGTILDPLSTDTKGNLLESGLYFNGKIARNVSSNNYSLTIGPWSDAAGIVQVCVYTDEAVYNDDWTEEPGRITLYSIKFTLPETAAAGDQYNIVWWDERNSVGVNGIAYDADYTEYAACEFADGFIKISEEECTDITCATDYIGSFYADDQTAVSSENMVITATMSGGSTLDITADCVVADGATPYSLYWDAYNAGNPTFEFTADFVYIGENDAVITYLEDAGTDVVCSVTLNIGQRGDVSLDHVADNYDASMIQKYLVDYSSYETLLQFGVVTDEPILNEENNEFALILSDCDANGEHVAGDAALLLKWEADSTEYALVQEFAGNMVTPADLALLWADIINQ